MKDRLARWIASILPRKIIYYATMRAILHATSGVYSDEVVDSVAGTEILRRWEKPNR